MLGAAVVLLFVGSGEASAVDVQHGIGFTKGCTSPTAVGQPYTCAFSVQNILDVAARHVDDEQLDRHGACGRRGCGGRDEHSSVGAGHDADGAAESGSERRDVYGREW